jgi:hypothetical protein
MLRVSRKCTCSTFMLLLFICDAQKHDSFTWGNALLNPDSVIMHGPCESLSFQRKDAWDVLWSPATTAHKSFEGGLRPGQLSSAVPGTQSLCKKKRLAETLVRAYGEEAFEIIPRCLIPDNTSCTCTSVP